MRFVEREQKLTPPVLGETEQAIQDFGSWVELNGLEFVQKRASQDWDYLHAVSGEDLAETRANEPSAFP